MEGVKQIMTEGDLNSYRGTLEEFLGRYINYTEHPGWYSSVERTWLQRKITLVDKIVSQLVYRNRLRYPLRNEVYDFHAVLAFTVMEDASEDENWDGAKAYIVTVINDAMGNIENDTIPSKEIEPVIPIKDAVLRERCLDLLQAPGNFDRAINQATLVLEARIRDSVPSYEKLSEVVPESKDLFGEALANKLLSPTKPLIVVSDKPNERVAFLKIVVGIIAYFRNPSHHFLDDKTRWSLAWSVVGIIDSLLSQLESIRVENDTKDTKRKTKQK